MVWTGVFFVHTYGTLVVIQSAYGWPSAISCTGTRKGGDQWLVAEVSPLPLVNLVIKKPGFSVNVEPVI